MYEIFLKSTAGIAAHFGFAVLGNLGPPGVLENPQNGRGREKSVIGRARAHASDDGGDDNAMTRRRTDKRLAAATPVWRYRSSRQYVACSGQARYYSTVPALVDATTMTRRRYPCAAERRRFLTGVALLLIGSWLTAGTAAGKRVGAGNRLKSVDRLSPPALSGKRDLARSPSPTYSSTPPPPSLPPSLSPQVGTCPT